MNVANLSKLTMRLSVFVLVACESIHFGCRIAPSRSIDLMKRSPGEGGMDTGPISLARRSLFSVLIAMITSVAIVDLWSASSLKVPEKLAGLKDIGMMSDNEIAKLDEAFITSSMKEVMPVVQIDAIKIGNGQVGAKTKHLMELFQAYTQNSEWPALHIPRYTH